MDQRRLDRLLGRLHQSAEGSSVLRRICSVAVDVTAMAGAGVSRIVDGRHDALDATDPWSTDVELLQVTLSEGPCVDAVESFEPCLEPDLASESALRRWPRFAPSALEHGVVASFAFPLMTDGVAIGALDVYSTKPGGIGPEQMADVMILAGLAGLAVERRGGLAAIAGVDLRAEPSEEWAYSAVVHNASGMLSERLGITVDEALLRLRAAAFVTEQRVADVALEVVERRLRLDRWSDDV